MAVLKEMFAIWWVDLLFVTSASLFNLLIAGLYLAQKRQRTKLVRMIGGLVVSLLVPFAFVQSAYFWNGRGLWINIGMGIVLLYLLTELLLDFIFRIEFRSKPLLHVPYIILFYLALGSLVGITFTISEVWGYVVSVTFWILLASLIYLYAGGRRHEKVESGAIPPEPSP